MKIINAKKYIIHCLVLIQIIFLSCDKKHSETPKEITDKTTVSVDQSLDSYWYQGKAEISSYELEQVRYGQKHLGDAVLIFVTEDFSKTKQVKLYKDIQAYKQVCEKIYIKKIWIFIIIHIYLCVGN